MIFAVLQFLCYIAKAQTDALHLYFGQRAGTRIHQQLMSSILERILARVSPILEASPEKQTSKFRRHKKQRSRGSGILVLNDAETGVETVNFTQLTAESSRVSAFFSSSFISLGAPLEITIGSYILYK